MIFLVNTEGGVGLKQIDIVLPRLMDNEKKNLSSLILIYHFINNCQLSYIIVIQLYM